MTRDTISRADVVSVVSVDGTSSVRRGRYRKTTEKPTSTTASSSSSSSDDSSLELKTSGKVPVYQVRGRSRNYKQNTETDKIISEATTAKSIGESGFRPVRRKSYQSNKQRTIARTENQSAEVANKDAVSSTQHAISSRKIQSNNSESESKPSANLPANHQPENHRKTYGDASTRKSPTGRRYRIRVAEANSINANGQTTQIEKKVISSTTPADDLKPTKKVTKKPERETIDDEQNYPEHFKALLKSKKSTVPPSSSPVSSRTNNFTSKKQASTTAAPSETTTTQRPAYKHKKIERPNLKLLFPSLHASTTTTEAAPSVTAIETDQTATDELNTETNEPAVVSITTPKIKTTVNRHTGAVKFSSKIRTENDDPSTSLSAFRSRSTPLVFDTLRSSTQRPATNFDVPSNHRYSSVSHISKSAIFQFNFIILI